MTKEEKYKKVGNTIKNIIIWISIAATFGLAPMIIAYFMSFVFPDFNFDLSPSIENGSILFFCSTLTAAALIDYVFSDMKFSKIVDLCLYSLPLLIILFGGMLYSQFCYHPEIKSDYSRVITIHYIVILLTFVYCVIIKFNDFYKKEKNG